MWQSSGLFVVHRSSACTILVEIGGEPFSELGGSENVLMPFQLLSHLCRCLKRTNVYCYYKAAFVVMVCSLCPLLLVSALLSFCARLGGIGAACRLCSSVIRKRGRESASQQDSVFYIHQKSCLLFAPALTCDSTDCSTTLLLRKSCTYHPLLHTTITPFSFHSFLPSNHALLQITIVPAVPTPPVV